ncbi:hypothetical protein [Arsenicicoccus piscis]|uniref:Uncharacterized protein n=1 Tax=Arsenicicoccus piscis TaxID=673954 RepID=A0ABQ6HS98_9MICO|nr:hypothetical protein [Arsenicicoccus piscis]GMA21358.1 hypothetical protein GCM10025862_33790 [Arsenicicoccus piscis]
MASRRPHLASIVEDKWHSRAERVLRARGWRTRALGYTGYGSPEQVRVLGRIKLAPSGKDSHGEPVEEKADPVRQLRGYDERRGWRSFTTPLRRSTRPSRCAWATRWSTAARTGRATSTWWSRSTG